MTDFSFDSLPNPLPDRGDTKSEVYRLLTSGHTVAQAAQLVGRAPRTVRYHAYDLIRKGIIESYGTRPKFFRRGPDAASFETTIGYGGGRPSTVPHGHRLRIHHLRVKFRVTDLSGAVLKGWKRWRAGKTDFAATTLPDGTVVRLAGTESPSLLVDIPAFYVTTADALAEMKSVVADRALGALRHVTNTAHIAADPTPIWTQKPHLALEDPHGRHTWFDRSLGQWEWETDDPLLAARALVHVTETPQAELWQKVASGMMQGHQLLLEMFLALALGHMSSKQALALIGDYVERMTEHADG